MPVVGDAGLPRDAGRRDALHHRERLRKKITEQLKERIGEEDIVAAGPEKRIRVPVKGTKRWQFILDRGKGKGVGQGDGEPGDVLGPPGGQGPPGEAGTEPGEELYEGWLDMEDVEEMLFSYWVVQSLRRRYDQTEIVFVAHTTEAREVTEHEFFNRTESGGTKVSSAFETVEEIQRTRFPAQDWNVYVLHVSDGDNFTADNARTLELIARLGAVCSLVGYLEVGGGLGGRHRLSAYYEREATGVEGFTFATARDDRELWPALKRFFAADRVEEAVR